MTIAILGEAIIDLIPDPDRGYKPYPGGSPYNVAIALARQQESVSYISPFSEDTFGDLLHKGLTKEKARSPLLRRSRNPTSIAVITTDQADHPTYQLYRQGIADKDISFSEIEAHLPSDLKIMHTGSLALTPSQLPKIRKLLQLMNERSITVSLDINIRLGATQDTAAYLQGVRSLLPFADIVKTSDEDLEPFEFAPTALEAAKIAFQEMGSGILVLTQGQADTVLFTAEATLKQKPQTLANIQDAIGAGDSFYAAFLAFLCRKQLWHLDVIRNPIEAIGIATLQDALRFANAAAAINLSRIGCSPPILREIEDFLAPPQ